MINLFQIQHKILRVVTRLPQVEAVYVFGSARTGKATGGSDVDIAILLSPTLSKQQRFALRLMCIDRFSRALKEPIDVVVLNDIASLFFKYVILKEGYVVYQKSESRRADFESRVFGEYFDFEPFLNAYNAQYVKNSL